MTVLAILYLAIASYFFCRTAKAGLSEIFSGGAMSTAVSLFIPAPFQIPIVLAVAVGDGLWWPYIVYEKIRNRFKPDPYPPVTSATSSYVDPSGIAVTETKFSDGSTLHSWDE